MANQLKLPYGLRGGQLWHISQVENGLACGCTCPGCGAALVARNAAINVKVAHFAHYQALECSTGLQTAIHLAAKDIIAQHKQLCLPGVVGTLSFTPAFWAGFSFDAQVYANDLFGSQGELKQRHVENEKRAEAQVYFSTVHRCKGLEYDAVQLTDDFITQERIDQYARDHARKPIESGALARILEEINLLYVALTRAKNLLYVPAACLPTGFVAGPGIVATHEGGGSALIQPPPLPEVPVVAVATPPAPVAPRSEPPPQLVEWTSLQQKLDEVSLPRISGVLEQKHPAESGYIKLNC